MKTTERTITRTINITSYSYDIITLDTYEVMHGSDCKVGKYTEPELMKIIENHHKGDNVKVLKITSITLDSALYAMDESMFLAHATRVER